MLLEGYLKSYDTWMLHKKQELIKFKGSSLEQTHHKVSDQGLYFTP